MNNKTKLKNLQLTGRSSIQGRFPNPINCEMAQFKLPLAIDCTLVTENIKSSVIVWQRACSLNDWCTKIEHILKMMVQA